MRVKLAAGNWKMNGLTADLAEVDALIAMHPEPRSEVLILPTRDPDRGPWRPARRADRVAVGAQACHTGSSGGAHTGDLSAAMLADAGAR